MPALGWASRPGGGVPRVAVGASLPSLVFSPSSRWTPNPTSPSVSSRRTPPEPSDRPARDKAFGPARPLLESPSGGQDRERPDDPTALRPGRRPREEEDDRDEEATRNEANVGPMGARDLGGEPGARRAWRSWRGTALAQQPPAPARPSTWWEPWSTRRASPWWAPSSPSTGDDWGSLTDEHGLQAPRRRPGTV